jgi:hypothetical protein
MKKWETPVLSVMHRSTSAEKVLVVCKYASFGSIFPNFQYGGCLRLSGASCEFCFGLSVS